jgi:DNA topoisomerase-1
MTAHWTTLSHNGVHFPPQYEPEGLSVLVKGKPVALTPLAEEMAYNLAKKKDTPYIKDPVFDENFMTDFSKQLPHWCEDAKFEEVDFSEPFARVEREKRAKEAVSKEQKKSLAAARKEAREGLKARFGYAEVDGNRVEMANWMVEPPGLFMGRGQHPMRGRWKPRVGQQDVTLNLGEGAEIPTGGWKEVVHDHDSMWMAKWVDKLTDKEKYVWLHEGSPLQQSRNKAKYDNAMKVGKNLDRIRDKIKKKLTSKDPRERQIATVCFLIDRLGMRVGDEKEGDEADTVGASTLRVEHVKIGNGGVDFDFLGKDSVRWTKSLQTPPPEVLRNLEEFIAKKQPDEEIFHEVTSAMVNDFLSSLVPGVTAKVFRTYHATAEAKNHLGSRDLAGADDMDKLFQAKEANLRAAVFCNHQRTPPKTWDQSLERKIQRLAEARAKAKPNQAQIKKLEMELDFYRRTKNYNLNTSMKNYIDPRVYKAWSDYVAIDWSKIYSKSLQKKFSWVTQSRMRWDPKAKELEGSASA